MNVSIRKKLIATGGLLLASAALASTAHAQSSGLPWVGTWGVAPASFLWQTAPQTGQLSFAQQTLRQIVHTSIGGSAARIHISNVRSSAPLTISDVHIADSSNGNSSPNTNPQTDAVVTFKGASTVTIPAGQEMLSDPINFTVPAQSDIAISIYFPGPTPAINSYVTSHVFTEEVNWFASGDASSIGNFSAEGSSTSYFFLTGLDVQNTSATGTLTTFGASITDGYNSTNLANSRWPNLLAQRFSTNGLTIGVLNEGIAGNQSLQDNDPIYGLSAAHRYTQDVLSQPSVRWVIYSDDPINDLANNPQPTAAQITAVYQSLITQAHNQQLKFLCSTLTPYKGYGTWNQQGEDTREAINTWIRGASSGCDAIVDQDLAVHDPNNPEAYLAAYDSGDHLHPNDAGYQAIAAAVPLNLFMQSSPLAPVVAPTSCGVLKAGQGFAPGGGMFSCDNRFVLTLQTDGNMVVYQGNTPLWTSGTYQKPSAEAVLNPNGSFVIYDVNGQPIWATNSDNNPNATLVMQNDGNLVMYSAAGQPVWNTYTNGH